MSNANCLSVLQWSDFSSSHPEHFLAVSMGNRVARSVLRMQDKNKPRTKCVVIFEKEKDVFKKKKVSNSFTELQLSCIITDIAQSYKIESPTSVLHVQEETNHIKHREKVKGMLGIFMAMCVYNNFVLNSRRIWI